MNFYAIQSLNSYTKNIEMEMKWQKKKTSGDFTADGTKTIDDWVKKQAEDMREAQKDGSTKLSQQIRLKLNSGKKLTYEEMEYLRKTDPQTYQHVKAIEEEQKTYEEELKRCKTKEEVQRVKMTHTASALSTVNSVQNNPNIPTGEKLKICWQILQKTAALEESTREFIESGRYGQLPTDAERQKAEQDLKEAEEAEKGIQDPTKDTAKEEATETEEHNSESSDIDKTDIEKAETTEKEAKKVLTDKGEMTRMEAELTPEARKVKRAKARAAYAINQAGGEPCRMVDVKVE